MLDKWQTFSQQVQRALIHELTDLDVDHPANGLSLPKPNGEVAQLQLMPFQSKVYAADAKPYFESVNTLSELIAAYQEARAAMPFEESLFSSQHLSAHAKHYVERLLMLAESRHSDRSARLLAQWVAQLDVYTAVKAVESLLNSHADMVLLHVASEQQWQVHFDHLAIRCGNQGQQAAEKVAALLCQQHGYHAPQIESEAYYVFADGWNAYPLYKMLENGQVLRLFIDQSDANAPAQIIQHWNYIYGFTAHHLGLRVSKRVDGQRLAVSLDEIIPLVKQKAVEVLTPTGMYTHGLLEQVFCKPEHENELPTELLEAVAKVSPNLKHVVKNAKLLEIVSRRELPESLKADFFALYDLRYNADNPLHSAPVYQYFLPAQAAHVIRTSVQTG